MAPPCSGEVLNQDPPEELVVACSGFGIPIGESLSPIAVFDTAHRQDICVPLRNPVLEVGADLNREHDVVCRQISGIGEGHEIHRSLSVSEAVD